MALASLGLAQEDVVLHSHSEHWKTLFEEERAVLKSLLGESVRDIYHIGSTAAAQIPAKPIIDILVSLHTLSDLETISLLMTEAGYEHHPAGSNEVRILFMKGGAEKRTHHIHLTEHQSIEWHKAFAFWEYLFTHPEELAAYGTLKQELAAKHAQNREEYSKGKAPFIKAILEKAHKENRL